LAPLFDLGLFPANPGATVPFEESLNERVVFKMNELPTDRVKAALTEFVIVQLHGHALRGEQPRHLTRLMVFDEANRIAKCPGLEALAREGRAFGVGIVLGTQFPGDIPEEIAGNIASQLFLHNNQVSHRRHVVKQVLGTTTSAEAQNLLQQFGALSTCEGLFVNQHHSRSFVSIWPHWQRR